MIKQQLILYGYEKYFMDSLNPDIQADDIEAFIRLPGTCTSMTLDMDNHYFERMVNQIKSTRTTVE